MNADIKTNPTKTKIIVEKIFSPQGLSAQEGKIKLLCHGTNFQIKVWEAVLTIPSGSVATYQTIARWIGYPQATRAVGNSIGNNPIAYLVPCHRVIKSVGHWSGYRWGIARKKAILAKEAASLEPN